MNQLDVEKLILSYLEYNADSNGDINVNDLVRYCERNYNLSKENLIVVLKQLAKDKKIEYPISCLEEDTGRYEKINFDDYFDWDYFTLIRKDS